MDSLHEVLDRFSEKSILVVGDVMLDHYIYGDTKRISPEAPIPILEKEKEEYVLGGAGNVVSNLVYLGVKNVDIITMAGDDDDELKIWDLLKELGVCDDYFIETYSRPTTVKTRVVSRGQQIVRIDKEKTHPMTDEEYEIFTKMFASKIKDNIDAIIVSDYSKGMINVMVYDFITMHCKETGTPVFVDPKGLYVGEHQIKCMKPNIYEAEAALGRKINPENIKDVRAAVSDLHFLTNSESILLTKNRHGMTIYDGKEITNFPATQSHITDVSGAGDTSISLFTLCRISGLSAKESAEIANLGAGIVVRKAGTATLTREEVLKEHISCKIMSEEQLERIIRFTKEQDKKVVFTNGCFDLLHVGHIKLLNEASKLGDILVVAINSDRVINEIKGDGRPYINQGERAEMLNSLLFVDYVTVFDAKTPIPLLKKLEPDILVKGGEYKKEEVVGWEVVEKYGGQIITIPMVDGKSTTNTANLIKRINSK